MGTVTNSDLIRAISARLPDLNEADCACSIESLLDYMASRIAAGHRIEIRRFGSFGLSQPGSGGGKRANIAAAGPQPYFRCGRQLALKLKNKQLDNRQLNNKEYRKQ